MHLNTLLQLSLFLELTVLKQMKKKKTERNNKEKMLMMNVVYFNYDYEHNWFTAMQLILMNHNLITGCSYVAAPEWMYLDKMLFLIDIWVIIVWI